MSGALKGPADHDILDIMKRMSALVIGTAFLLAGCGLGSAPEVIESKDGAKLLVSSYRGEGMEALLSGKLEVGPGNCLYLTGDSWKSLVFWANGTQFSKDGSAVKTAEFSDLVIGTEISVGGGGIDPAAEPGSYPEIPEGCIADNAVRVN